MPFCTYCGKEVSEDASVCPHCGKRLGIGVTVDEKQPPNKVNGLTVAGLVVGAIGSWVVILAGISTVSDIPGVGFGFIGLGIFFVAILCFLFAGRSKS